MNTEMYEPSSDIPNPDEWDMDSVLALAARTHKINKDNKGPVAPIRETRRQAEEVLDHLWS